MKNFLYAWLLIIVVISLTACSVQPKIVTVEKEVPVFVKETVIITVPDHLLQQNKPPKPPDLDLYLKSSWTDREDLLVTFSRKLEKELMLCLADKKAIKENIQEKIKLYQKDKKE